MFRIGAVEPVITVAAARDQIGCLKLGQLVLDSLQREKAQTRQLPHVEFLSRIGEQELKNLGPDGWEQSVQKRLAHAAVITRPL
jgi:hypothetical protein